MRAGRMDGACGPDDALSALRLLAVLCLRTHSARSTVHEQFKGLDDSAFHSLWTELNFLDQHVDDPLERFIARLIEQRIMRRHLWVAMRKLRYQGDYTFLIEADNGRVRLRGKDGPVFTNPRLAPAITFLKDILLIDKNGLTSDGRRVLAEA